MDAPPLSPVGGGASARPPRGIRADNPSPLTLDGTRSWIVGDRCVAIIDPGPSTAGHLDALERAVAGASVSAILLTHRHPDHDAGAADLAARVDAPVRAFADGGLAPGQRIETDAGDLVVVATPGHTPDHVAFHWPADAAVFCGDLMLGGQDTALVAPPEGDLGEYLASLRRLAALRPRVIHPAHGPSFDDPADAIGRYVRHREERETQVLEALGEGPASPEALLDRVYGPALPAALAGAARGALLAYLEHLRGAGRVRAAAAGRWERVEPGAGAAP